MGRRHVEGTRLDWADMTNGWDWGLGRCPLKDTVAVELRGGRQRLGRCGKWVCRGDKTRGVGATNGRMLKLEAGGWRLVVGKLFYFIGDVAMARGVYGRYCTWDLVG